MFLLVSVYSVMLYNIIVSPFQYKRGFCNLVGVDYSSAAVMMAEALAEKENAVIRFEASLNRCIMAADVTNILHRVI